MGEGQPSGSLPTQSSQLADPSSRRTAHCSLTPQRRTSTTTRLPLRAARTWWPCSPPARTTARPGRHPPPPTPWPTSPRPPAQSCATCSPGCAPGGGRAAPCCNAHRCAAFCFVLCCAVQCCAAMPAKPACLPLPSWHPGRVLRAGGARRHRPRGALPDPRAPHPRLPRLAAPARLLHRTRPV